MKSDIPKEKRALHFPNGQVDLAQLGDDAHESVTKLVLGTPPVGDEEKKTITVTSDQLGKLLARLPALTHLYLWSVKGLSNLPKLGHHLICLDVRNCVDLLELPDPLPRNLEILDVGDCHVLKKLPPQLPKGLKELYVNDCPKLEGRHHVQGGRSSILSELPGMLEVFDATRTAGVSELPAALLDPLHYPFLRDLRVETGIRIGEYVVGDDILKPFQGQNAITVLRSWWEGIARSGVDTTPYVKVFLLGNGEAGKTQICRFLAGEPLNARWDSTHGAQLATIEPEQGRIKLPGVGLVIWDFGGQDIYHGTHALFTDSKALYVIVWTADPMRQGRKWGEPKPVQYWVEYVSALSRPDPGVAHKVCRVLIAESGCNSGESVPQATIPNELDALKLGYDINPKFAEEYQIEGGQGLLAALRQKAKQVAEDLLGVVPVSWARLRDELRSSDTIARRLLSPDEFSERCRKHGIADDDGIRSVRGYLHQCGAIFHRPGLFHGRIVVDQQWAFDAIYAVLDRDPKNPLRKAGRDGSFTIEELQRTLWKRRQLSFDEASLLVEMMQECGICFRWGQTEAGETRYLAPELLPARGKLQSRLLTELETNYPTPLRQQDFRYDFVHAGILRGIMAKAGVLAGTGAAYWKSGFCVFERSSGIYVVVEASFEGDTGKGILNAKCYGPADASPRGPWTWITGLLEEQRPLPEANDLRTARAMRSAQAVSDMSPAGTNRGMETESASHRKELPSGLQMGPPQWEFEVEAKSDFATSRQVELRIRSNAGRGQIRSSVKTITPVSIPSADDLAKYLAGQHPDPKRVLNEASALGKALTDNLRDPGELKDFKVANALHEAIGDQRGVRFLFRGDQEFHRVPWELMRGDSDKPFCLTATFQRHEYREAEDKPLFPKSDTMKVLWVTSRPQGIYNPSAESVWEPVSRAVKRTGVQIVRSPTGILQDLYDSLNDQVWHAVHLDMHADVMTYEDLMELCPHASEIRREPLGRLKRWEGEEGILLFSSGENEMVPVRASEMQKVLSCAGVVPLLTQNSCKSAVVPKNSVYSSLAWQLVRAGVPGVVGFQGVVTVDLAVRFFEEFYAKLAPKDRGEKVRIGDVAYAVREGRKKLSLNTDRHGVEIEDWWLPVFYGSENLQLFDR